MDHVPLLTEALLLFNEGTQRLLIRKGILVSEVDKLLLQVVMLRFLKEPNYITFIVDGMA